MKIKNLYEYLNFLLNKYNYYVDKEDIVEAIHNASMTLFIQRYGNPAEYQPGRPLPRVAYQLTQKVSDDLKVFLKEKSYRGTEIINGAISYPLDLAHPTRLTWVSTGTRVGVTFVDDDKVDEKLNCPITGPTERYPFAEILSNGLRVYPASPVELRLKYLSYPVKPKYVTRIEDGDEVFDEVASIDIQWPETTFRQLAMIALGDFGVNLKDQQIQQYSEFRKREGV
jgi:hypothetical protein